MHCRGGWILISRKKSDRKFKQQGYVLFEALEGKAAGSGAPKAEKLPDSLLERRLMKAREEKGELAAKVTKLDICRLP